MSVALLRLLLVACLLLPSGSALLAQEPATWYTQADGWRGQNGQRVSLVCPGDGHISDRLWGTDLYTDDSSICTAAVHAGLISRELGGTVTIEIRPGASTYESSTRNGVLSKSWGEHAGSFMFVGGTPCEFQGTWTSEEDPSCSLVVTVDGDVVRGTASCRGMQNIVVGLVHANRVVAGFRYVPPVDNGGLVTYSFFRGCDGLLGESFTVDGSRSWTGRYRR